jgi:ABC-type glycerol-3-phosphate transport system substrate-binding protein
VQLTQDFAHQYPGCVIRFIGGAEGYTDDERRVAVENLPRNVILRPVDTGALGGALDKGVRFVPLDTAIRTLGKTLPRAAQLLLPSFQLRGKTYGLPQAVSVAHVQVNNNAKSVLVNSGAMHGGPWTLAEFIAFLRVVKAQANGQPVLGGDFFPLTKPGLLVAPYVWASFARGFGAKLVDGGGIRLATPEALEGLSVLVGLVREFAVHSNALVEWSVLPSAVRGTVMPTEMPFPRMPIVPVLPFAAFGWGIDPQPYPEDLDITLGVSFMELLYDVQWQRILADMGVPVLTRLLSGPEVMGYVEADLWSVDGDFPLDRSGGRGYLYDIGEALKGAIEDPVRLRDILARVDREVNRIVAQ